MQPDHQRVVARDANLDYKWEAVRQRSQELSSTHIFKPADLSHQFRQFLDFKAFWNNRTSYNCFSLQNTLHKTYKHTVSVKINGVPLLKHTECREVCDNHEAHVWLLINMCGWMGGSVGEKTPVLWFMVVLEVTEQKPSGHHLWSHH